MNTQAEVSTRELPLAKLAHLPAEDLRILADIKRALVRTIGTDHIVLSCLARKHAATMADDRTSTWPLS
jgi:hypothetical protein